MSTHIAAYDNDDDVIYEPPRRILGIDIVGECCFLMFFDHVDQATGEADICTATRPPYVQIIVPPGTLLRVWRLQTSARHVRSARIPALREADTFPCADEVLLVSVIGTPPTSTCTAPTKTSGDRSIPPGARFVSPPPISSRHFRHTSTKNKPPRRRTPRSTSGRTSAMSNRTRAAWQLRRRLEMETEVGVEVIWDKSAGSGRWGWQVHWSDGPTVAAMRAIAERALREIAGLDPDALRYSRMLGLRAIALAMIRQVRLGQPPLGDPEDLWTFLDALDGEAYPEQGSEEELAAANRLARLSDGLDWRMAQILEQRGLAALAEPADSEQRDPPRPPTFQQTTLTTPHGPQSPQTHGPLIGMPAGTVGRNQPVRAVSRADGSRCASDGTAPRPRLAGQHRRAGAAAAACSRSPMPGRPSQAPARSWVRIASTCTCTPPAPRAAPIDAQRVAMQATA